MLRRKARERREYLYRKSVEDQHRKIQDKKDRVRRAVEDHSLIDTDLKRDALELQVSWIGLCKDRMVRELWII